MKTTILIARVLVLVTLLGVVTFLPDSLHAQTASTSGTITSTLQHNGKVFAARVDPKSGAPVWILDPDALDFSSRKTVALSNESAVLESSRAFLEDHLDVFQVDPNQLLARNVRTDGRLWFVDFIQTHRGVPVLNSDVGITVTATGKLVAAGSRAFPSIEVDTTPVISGASAIQAAKSEAKIANIFAIDDPELVIVPEAIEDQYTFRLVWKVRLSGDTSGEAVDRTVFVDAQNQSIVANFDNILTHSPLVRVKPFYLLDGASESRSPVRFTQERTPESRGGVQARSAPENVNSVFGYVTLNYYETPDDYTQPLNRFTGQPLVGAKVTVTDDQTQGSQTTYADASGYYSVSGLNSGSHTVTFEIANQRAHIESGVSASKTEKSVQVDVTGATRQDYSWGWGDDGDGGLTSYALNGVYHVREMYDYFKDTYGYDYDGINAVDHPLVISSSGSGSTAGQTNGVKIWIGSAEAMSSEVTLHEYTHDIIYRLYNNAWMHTSQSGQAYDESYAMDEGFADYFAADQTNDFTFGGPAHDSDPNAPPGDGVGIRFLWNEFTMNDWRSTDMVESVNPLTNDTTWSPHRRGRIISGAVWRVRNSIGAEASDILFSALQITPLARTFEELRDRYVAADNAANSGANNNAIEQKFTDRYIGGPDSPTNPFITLDGNGFPTVQWTDRSVVENGYKVERRFNSGSWSVIGSLAANTTSYYDNDYRCVGGGSGTYYYRVQAYYTNSGHPDETSYSPETWLDLSTCDGGAKAGGRGNEADGYVPAATTLAAAYPNPFNPETTIIYSLAEDGPVRLLVSDILGREVAELVNATKRAGRYEVNFDASRLPSGLYIYRLETAGRTLSRTMLLTK